MSYKINGKIEDRVLLHLVPHGIDSETFTHYNKDDNRLIEFRNKVFGNRDYKFAILYNSRNIQRKRTSNIILAYRVFCDNLSKEEASKCVLILHTEIMQDAGTNLLALKEAFCPEYNVIFSPGKLSPQDMCLLYNTADITVNASSSEGFGLSAAESIMCGTPVVITVTGGLQDQIGQVDDNGKPIEFNEDFASNNCGKYKKCGPWAYPLWPATRLVQGSLPTPFIFDDLTKWEDIADGYMYWYMMKPKEREKCGIIGRNWVMNEGGLNSKNMGQLFIEGMEYVFRNWTKPKMFDIYTVKNYVGNVMPGGHMGFEIPKIDKDLLQNKINNLKI